jgi:hypothetical protein
MKERMSRGRRWILILTCLALLLASLGAAWRLYLPGFLKGRLESAFARVAERWGVRLAVDAVQPDLSGRLSLPLLTARVGEREVARVEGLEVVLDPVSFLYGAGVVEAVTARRLHLDLDDVSARALAERNGAETGEGAAPGAGEHPGGRLPLVRRAEVQALDGAAAWQGNRFEVASGSLEASFSSVLLDEPAWLVAGRLALKPENAQQSNTGPPKRGAEAAPIASWGERGASLQNSVSFSAQVAAGRKVAGQVTFERRQEFSLRGRRVAFKAVTLDLPERVGLEDVEVPPFLAVERVLVPFPAAGGDLRAILQQVLGQPVSVTRPRLQVDRALLALLEPRGAGWVAGVGAATGAGGAATAEGASSQAPAELPALPAGTLVAKSSQRFHAFFRGALLRGLARLEGALQRLGGAAKVLPVRDLKVTDGEVRFAPDLINAFPVLADVTHLDAGVSLGPDGVFEGTLEFETARSQVYRNRMRFRLTPEGAVSLSARVDQLPAYPFQAALPDAIIMDPASQLKGVDASLEYRPASRDADLSLRFELAPFHFFNPKVSSFYLRELALSADVALHAAFNPPALALTRGEFAFNGVPFSLTATVADVSACPAMTLAFNLPSLPVQELVGRLPEGLLPLVHDAIMKGELAFQAKGGFDACQLDELDYDSVATPRGLEVESIGSKVDFEAVLGRFTKEIEDEDGKGRVKVITREFGPGTPGWTPLPLIPPDLVKVVTTTEDGNFFEHTGFSPRQIKRAFAENLEHLGFAKGASTISQQVVKNLFLSREKTLSRKIQEMIITWQMEKTLTKEQILELYFNIIELGPDVYGVKEAARHYFCKRPRDLSLLESLFLATILPNPKRYHKFLEKGRVSAGWKKYLEALLEIMVKRGKITEEQARVNAPYDVKFHVGECGLELEVDPVPGVTVPMEGDQDEPLPAPDAPVILD